MEAWEQTFHELGLAEMNACLPIAIADELDASGRGTAEEYVKTYKSLMAVRCRTPDERVEQPAPPPLNLDCQAQDGWSTEDEAPLEEEALKSKTTYSNIDDTVKVKALIDRVWTKISSHSKTDKFFPFHIDNEVILIPYPKNKDKLDNDKILTNIQNLEKQISLLHSVLKSGSISIEDIKQEFRKSAQNIELQCSKQASKIMWQRIYCTWLIARVIDYQAGIHDQQSLGFNSVTTKEGIVFLVKQEANVRVPLLYPDASDFKPISRFDDNLILQIRNFIFMEPDPSVRFNVSGRLDQKEFTSLLKDEISFWNDIIRYTQLTCHEFLQFMFYRDKEGKKRRATCLCEIQLQTLSQGVGFKDHGCKLSKYIMKHLPHILKGNIIATKDTVALSEKDSNYIKDILTKRLPVRISIVEDGYFKIIRQQTGEDDKVLSVKRLMINNNK